jgi:undecaprenyl-diphosphatase
MFEFLYSIDKSIFNFCNQIISNPLFDILMPPITNWNQSRIGLGLAIGLWLLLFWKGGKKGRTVAFLLIPLILLSDQISSAVIKPLVARARPCHLVNSLPIIENIHLLVPCGPGYSFPSSHAVNNFAFATFISFYYRRWTWLAYTYAGIMGFSRISVGVHYPSDVIGGAMIGALCAYLIIVLWQSLSKTYPILSVE